jgi:hypothetical protein
MKALAGFFIAGLIRVLRSKTDFALFLAWPIASVIIVKIGSFPHDLLPLILLVTLGSQIAVSAGYDYGRIRETGALCRMLATGTSPVALFVGINLSRFIGYAVSGAFAICFAGLAGIRIDPYTTSFMLIAGCVVYTALGLVVLRIVRNALGVLSALPVILLLLSLPAFSDPGSARGFPGYASPVSSLFAVYASPSAASIIVAALWVIVSIAGMKIFSFKGK